MEAQSQQRNEGKSAEELTQGLLIVGKTTVAFSSRRAAFSSASLAFSSSLSTLRRSSRSYLVSFFSVVAARTGSTFATGAGAACSSSLASESSSESSPDSSSLSSAISASCSSSEAASAAPPADAKSSDLNSERRSFDRADCSGIGQPGFQ